jgi:hypothetical protein
VPVWSLPRAGREYTRITFMVACFVLHVCRDVAVTRGMLRGTEWCCAQFANTRGFPGEDPPTPPRKPPKFQVMTVNMTAMQSYLKSLEAPAAWAGDAQVVLLQETRSRPDQLAAHKLALGKHG